jgi:hypothetical protein
MAEGKRSKSDGEEFLWRDWWFGVYRRGFSGYLEADHEQRKRASLRAVLVTCSLIPLVAFLIEAATWRIDAGWLHYERGTAALARGDSQTGLRELRNAVEESPGRLQYRLRLGWELVKVRLVGQAVGQLARGIHARPGFVAVLLLGGFVSYYGSMVMALYLRSKARSRIHSPS